MATVRSYVAAGAMTSVALTMLARAHDGAAVGFAALALAAGALFTRRSVVAQVLARGAAWSFILPLSFVVYVSMRIGGFHPPLASLIVPALSAAALVLAHPMLHIAEAKASFAPLALRSWFLAAAAGAVGAGIAFAQLAMAFVSIHMASTGLPLLALGASLLATGVGLARMRAWSLLTSALATLLAIGFVLSGRMFALSWPVLGALVPGAMLFAGVAVARILGVAQVAPPAVRIARDVRVALDEDEDVADEPAWQEARSR